MSIPNRHVILINLPHGIELDLDHVPESSVFDQTERQPYQIYLGYVLEFKDYLWASANMVTKSYVKVYYCTDFDEFNSLIGAFNLNIDIKELFL